jgi:hypothetical protein
MTLRSLLAAAALAASAAPALAQDPSIQPGYWSVTNRIELVLNKTTKENRCITPAEVAKFMTGPSNRHYVCTYPDKSFQDGQISLKGTCVDKYGKTVDIVATGAYSPSSLHLDAHIAASYAGLPIKARFVTDGRRLGDVCPANAPHG